jgi:4-aminobutyrate aminotransferase/(S)-3-amino-2-methylpropionate transaminase
MPAIELKTEIPGPRSRALMQRRDAVVAAGIGYSAPIFVERASGARLTDVDGNTFIDFAGGIGTLNVGHCHPSVVAAAQTQLSRYLHTCFTVTPYEPYVALAERLVALTPGTFAKKVMLASSGAEAVENAVKIARRATGRAGVVVFEHAFHGRTLFALGMTSKAKPYKQGFGPYAGELYRMPYPYAYRREAPLTEAAIRAELHEFFSTQVAAENVACVVMELVTGEGGFIVAPPLYVRLLTEFCRANGIVFIADEIQTGFGRTGKMFAAEHYNLEPDVMVLAKSLAGGLPLSAIVGRAEIMDAAQLGGLGGTYVGNPVACAAALAVLDVYEREQLVARGAALGERARAFLDGLAQQRAYIGESRGLGAMRALELVTDRASKTPDKDRTAATIKRAYQRGLIVLSAGTFGNVLRLLAPLTISDAELDEGLAVLADALAL